MILSFNIYSQNASTTTEGENLSFENSTTYFNTTGESNFSQEDSRGNSNLGFLIKTILVLVLVIAAIYGLMWFFKKKNTVTQSDDDFLRRVSSLTLSPGKSVEIVSLLDHAYILGVTDSNINLISEIQDKELIEAMNLNFDKKQNVKKPMNFNDVLEIFMPRNSRNNSNVFSEAENTINNLDSSQTEN